MQVSLRDILNRIFMNINYLITFSIILIFCTSIYLGITKKVYESQAKILVKLGFEQTGTLSFLNAAQNVYISRRKQDLKNEAEILTSKKVIENTAREILGDRANNKQLFSKTVNLIASNLKVNPLYESDTLEVFFKFTDPVLAQKILNTIIKNYMSLHIHIYSSKKELNLLENEVNNYREKFKQLQKELTDFMNRNNFYGDKSQLIMMLKQKNAIATNLVQAIADYKYSEDKVKKLRNVIKQVEEYVLTNVTEERNKNLENIETKLREAIIEKKNLLMRYQPNSRFVKDVEAEIELLKKLKMLEPEYIINRKDKQINEYYKELQSMLLKYETEMLGNQSKIEVFKKQLKELNSNLEKYIHNLNKYVLLDRDVNLTKYIYENFAKNLSQTKLKMFSEKQKILNISLIETPSLNNIPVWPKKKFVILMAIALLILGNITIVTMFSFIDTKIKFPYDIDKDFKDKFLSDFPYIDSNDRKNINDNFFQKFVREFQRIYIKNSNNKVISITACTRGEGVTTFGINFSNFLKTYHNKNVAYISFDEFDYKNINIEEKDDFKTIFKNDFGVVFYNLNLFKTENSELKEIDFEEIKEIKNLLLDLKNKYDILLFDISPMKNIINLAYITELIEATITIVEAEKIKKEVLNYNINIAKDFKLTNLFFVLNKRKFYIPKWIIKHV